MVDWLVGWLAGCRWLVSFVVCLLVGLVRGSTIVWLPIFQHVDVCCCFGSSSSRRLALARCLFRLCVLFVSSVRVPLCGAAAGAGAAIALRRQQGRRGLSCRGDSGHPPSDPTVPSRYSRGEERGARCSLCTSLSKRFLRSWGLLRERLEVPEPSCVRHDVR